MQAEKTFPRSSNSALKILTGSFVSFLIFTLSLHAEIINVPDDFETIQAAINESEDGDTVLVQPGEYVENINFEGRDIVVMGNPDDPTEVVIDGDENGSVVTFESEEGHDAILTGFTIRNGVAETGGGIFCNNADPTISYCLVTENTATQSYGGGIFCHTSDVIIIHCIFRDNEASRLGGGGLGFMSNSNPTISFCSITDNNAIHSAGIYFHHRIDAIVTNCTISNNTADNYGGGIRLAAECRVTLINSILWDNTPQEASVISNDILTVSYSDINGGRNGIQLSEDAQLNWDEGNIDEDPLFVDREEGDYNLSEDSPCIDAGTAFFVWEGDTLVDIPEDEYNGNAPDMGAFESEFTDVTDDLVELPDEFRLHPAFPNPFNSSTELRFDLPAASDVTLKIYDLTGREVLFLTDNLFVSGRYEVTWNASDMPSGIYLARLEASGYKQTAKLILVR